MFALAVLIVTVAYLLGSFPSGYVYTRLFKRVDIREIGDHYTGAKNVYVNVGPAAGMLTAFTDIAKGSAAMALARFLPVPEATILFAGIAVVAGHIWPVYLKFRDGAGAMTAGGALLVILPLEVIVLAPVAAITFAISKRTTVAVGVYVALPLLAWYRGESAYAVLLPVFLGVLIGLRVFRRQIKSFLGMQAGNGGE